MEDVVALGSRAVLAAVALAGLSRLRLRRFRAAAIGGARPDRVAEAVVFASLLGVALAGVGSGAPWRSAGAACLALVAIGVAAWLARERVDPGAARRGPGALVAAVALAAGAGAAATGVGASGAGAAALFAAGVAFAAARAHTAAGGTSEVASALVLLGAALGLDAAAPSAASAAAGALRAAGAVCAALAGVQLLRFAGEREHPRPARRAPGGTDAFVAERELKRDLFGRIERGFVARGDAPLAGVRRDFRAGALWLRPIAAVLARREARALDWLEGVERVPRLLDRGRGRFLRSYVEGRPLLEVAPTDPAYFAEARRLLHRIHAVGVTHNDTHKVHNWLVAPDGGPALVDFQIAGRHMARTRWFRLCARDDVRHLLKQKRRFCPGALTERERAIVERRSFVSRTWLATVKPVYLVVTRRLLAWRDAEGRGGAPR